jgi:hypothetical protein
LLLAGVVDGDQLIDAVRAGYERGKGSLQGCTNQPTRPTEGSLQGYGARG